MQPEADQGKEADPGAGADGALGPSAHRVLGDVHFRWRGGDVSRLEALSDAVFALAITLLVVSFEVPRTFDDVLAVMAGIPAFAMGLTMILMVWYFHYLYHRRYGFEDFATYIWNALLLFVVLLYVYPLRFMAHFLQRLFSGGDIAQIIRREQVSQMMVLYGLGVVLVFGVLHLMYRHAWRKRDELGLNEVERYLTRQGSVSHLWSVAIGALSVALALLLERPIGPWASAISGWSYMLMWPVHAVHGGRIRREVERLTAAASA